MFNRKPFELPKASYGLKGRARRPPAPDPGDPPKTRCAQADCGGTPLTPSSGDTTYPIPPIQVTAQEQDMNAPPSIDPVTAHSDSDVVHWLTNDARDERFIDNIFAELCVRLQRAGIPVKRATLHVLIHHPQWLGARIMWADGMREAELARVDYDVRERSEYIGSPANEIHDGATEVREDLERDPSLGRKHAVYDEMRAKDRLRGVAAVPYARQAASRDLCNRPARRFRRRAYRPPVETVAGSGAGQRNPYQEPAGANAARNLCRVACRRTHSGRRHQARKRDDGTRSHHDLRSA